MAEEQALPLPLARAAAAATPLRLGLSVAFPETTEPLVEALRGQVRRQGRKFSKAESPSRGEL